MHDESPQPCEPRQQATDYEDGFDEDQQHILKSKALKQKKFCSEYDHWKKIFQVVFPDWTEDIPNPCKVPVYPFRKSAPVLIPDVVLTVGVW